MTPETRKRVQDAVDQLVESAFVDGCNSESFCEIAAEIAPDKQHALMTLLEELIL